MPVRAAARIGILFPNFYWPRGHTYKGKGMPMRACARIGILCYPTLLGHMAKKQVGDKYAYAWGLRAATHWHTFPLFFWATWPRQVGEKVCQCAGLHAAPRIVILVSLLFLAACPRQVETQSLPMRVLHAAALVLAMWPRQVSNALGCMQPHALANCFPYLSGPCGPQQ